MIHRGYSKGSFCTIRSLCWNPCHFPIGCSAFICTAGITASCGTYADSLECGDRWSLLPGKSYIWWTSPVPAGSLRVVRKWCRGGIVVEYMCLLQWVVASRSWISDTRWLWLRRSRRTCSSWASGALMSVLFAPLVQLLQCDDSVV
jgi:hypothetical protein